MGHSDIGVRMKVLRTDMFDHLLAFVATENISFSCAESSEVWDLLKAALQLGQAFPRVDPNELLERIGRKAIESPFDGAAAGRQGLLWEQFVPSGLAAMISDAVAFWAGQLLVLSAVNAFRGLQPVLLMIIGDFTGMLNAY
jgi:hypothetical protein